jgi:site-specific DNA-cytosine methylase
MEFPDSLDEPSRTISSHTVEGTKRETIVLPIMIVRAGKDDVREYRDSPSPTIMNIAAGGPRQGRPLVLDGVAYRRLTVRECLRLQSFPDWYRFPEHISISKRYKLVGEAVPPILAYRLAVHIGKLLGLETREPPRQEEWQLPYFHRSFHDYF